MPEIELPPGNARRIEPPDKKGDRQQQIAYIFGLLIDFAVLGYIFVHRDEFGGQTDVLVGFTALMAFFAGGIAVLLADSFKRRR